jgi:hypothetical protein
MARRSRVVLVCRGDAGFVDRHCFGILIVMFYVRVHVHA